jgi:hypothetical protein
MIRKQGFHTHFIRIITYELGDIYLSFICIFKVPAAQDALSQPSDAAAARTAAARYRKSGFRTLRQQDTRRGHGDVTVGI